MCNTNKVSINDENVLNSMMDRFERLWISVKSHKTTFALGVVYFPVDNIRDRAEEAQNLQQELIQNIAILENQFDNVLLVGDFNGKAESFRQYGKPSSNGQLLDNLMEVTDMILLNDDKKCSGKITWSRGLQSSVIDYALCSTSMYAIIKSLHIDEDHNFSIGSDHNAIIINIAVTKIESVTHTKEPEITKWNITNDTNWTTFQTELDRHLQYWNTSEYANVDDMWLDLKQKLLQVGESCIGYKKCGNKREYWDKEVDKLIKDRRKSNQIYRLWSKHPDSSPELLQMLWDNYIEKKKNVAHKIKQNAIDRKLRVINENAAKAANNTRAYWKMLRKLNKANDYPIRIRDPEDPDVIIDDPIEIKKKLTKYWSSLGHTNKVVTDEQTDRLQKLETSAPQPDALKSITFDIGYVKSAILRLKSGKAVGPDKIPGEFLKYGGPSLQDAVLKIFCKIKVMEKIPEEWYEGFVKPIFKEGSKEFLSNYRGITISSVIYKVLVSIIEKQTMTFLEEKDILGEYQGAFRKNRRCEDQLFSLKGICDMRKNKKQKTYLAFLDVSKAFDTIDRVQLFNHIWDKGIQGKAWRLVRMLYKRVDNRVIFGKFESDTYEVLNGVKQGCILSPCLFNLAMVDLQDMLSQQSGVPVGDQEVHGLFYADDIVLMAQNDNDLLEMLKMADAFSLKWNLRFNKKKSQILVVGKRMSDRKWPLGDMLLGETKTYKYLGVIINRRLTDSDHVKSHLSEKAKKLEAYIRYILANNMNIRRISFGNTLWHKAVLPGLSHAAGIWFNDTKSAKDSISSSQYKCAKAVLQLKCMPSRAALLADLGWPPISDHLDILRAAYFKHLRDMDNKRLAKVVFNEMMKNHAERRDNKTGFKYLSNVKRLFEERGADHMFANTDLLDIPRFKQAVNASYITSFQKDTAEHSSLILFRTLKDDVEASEYLTNDNTSFRAKQLKFKMRAGVLGLGADITRQHRGDGVCKMCGCFETVKHFILSCPAYNVERQHMILNIKQSITSEEFDCFISNMDFALTAVLGSHDDYFNKHFMLYIEKAWSIRNEQC